MNKLWILRPIKGHENLPRDPWRNMYDVSFGFVVSAPGAKAARMIASDKAGDEGALAWYDQSISTCKELKPGKCSQVEMMDFNAG